MASKMAGLQQSTIIICNNNIFGEICFSIFHGLMLTFYNCKARISYTMFTISSPHFPGVSSIAYHSRKNMTLWADSMVDKIMSLLPDGNSTVVVGHGIVSIKTIEVDHVTDKVYW